MNNAPASKQPAGLKRLAWFVVIWAASVAALGVVAYLLRLLMNGLGLAA